MSIWKIPFTLEDIAVRGRDTMVEHMGVRFTAIGEDSLTATLPVDHRSRQYLGILHGGASAFLAETVASVAANLAVDPHTHVCVGLEINANHLRPVPAGTVTATATAVHLGQTTQVWDVRLTDDRARLCCVARMTMAVRRRADLGLAPATP